MIDKHISIKSLFLYIFLFLCILDCNTIYSTNYTHNFHIALQIEITLILLVILELNKLKANIVFNWVKIIIPYLFLNCIVIWKCVSMKNIIYYLQRYVFFVPLLILVLLIEYRKDKFCDLLFKYSDIVYYYSIITLIIWIPACLVKILPPTGMIVYDWGGIRITPLYFGLLNVSQKQSFLGYVFQRNIGVFTEAPMFNLILSLAIICEMYIKPKDCIRENRLLQNVNKRRLFILILTDITTFTTTGLILLVCVFALKYCLISNKNKTKKILKWLGAIIVLFLATYLINKIFLGKSSDGSWSVRSDDFRAGYLAWSENFLFGTGFNIMDAINRHMSPGYVRNYNFGYSSGLFEILAQGGILLFLVYIISYIGFVKQAILSKKYNILAYLVIFSILLITTIFQYSFIMMIFISYGYILLFLKPVKERI